MGSPIRTSPDHSVLTAPRSFSQLATSFIAFLCLGIPTHALSSLTIKFPNGCNPFLPSVTLCFRFHARFHFRFCSPFRFRFLLPLRDRLACANATPPRKLYIFPDSHRTCFKLLRTHPSSLSPSRSRLSPQSQCPKEWAPLQFVARHPSVVKDLSCTQHPVSGLLLPVPRNKSSLALP